MEQHVSEQYQSEAVHTEELEVPTEDAAEQAETVEDEPVLETAEEAAESDAVTDEPASEAADALPLGDEVAEEALAEDAATEPEPVAEEAEQA
jgi:hypothetical protein